MLRETTLTDRLSKATETDVEAVGDLRLQACALDLSSRLRQVYELKLAEAEEPLVSWPHPHETDYEHLENEENNSRRMPLLYQSELDAHRRHPAVAARLQRVQQICIRRQYRRILFS